MPSPRIDPFNSQPNRSLRYATRHALTTIVWTGGVVLLIMLLFIVGSSIAGDAQKTYVPVSYVQNPDTFIIGQSYDGMRVYFYGIDENGNKVLIKSVSDELEIAIDYSSINPYFTPTTRHAANYRGGILVVNKPVKFITIDESQVHARSYKIR